VWHQIIKRSFDLVSTVILLLVLIVPMIIIALLVKATSKGHFLYWSERVGKDNLIFGMPKFRTMRIDTPAVATHLLSDPDQFLTPIGSFLRRSMAATIFRFRKRWSLMSIICITGHFCLI